MLLKYIKVLHILSVNALLCKSHNERVAGVMDWSLRVDVQLAVQKNALTF